MRSVGSELLSIAEVLAIPLVIAAAFPRDAIGFDPVREETRGSGARTASIVFLDETAATRVLRAARTVSRGEDSDCTYIDLVFAELPKTENEPMATVGARQSSSSDPPLVENGIPPFLPSRRAAAPARISAETKKDAPAFPRDELLKLN